jgi:hypothetical protein
MFYNEFGDTRLILRGGNLMTRFLVKTKDVHYQNISGDDLHMQLEYSIMETEIDNKKIYGIEVIKKCGEFIESELIKGLSESKEFATNVIKLLSENEVTPIAVINVLDNLYT